MDWLPAIVGGSVALPLGWLFGQCQHLLYRQPEFRAEPLRNGDWRLLPYLLALAIAAV